MLLYLDGFDFAHGRKLKKSGLPAHVFVFAGQDTIRPSFLRCDGRRTVDS